MELPARLQFRTRMAVPARCDSFAGHRPLSSLARFEVALFHNPSRKPRIYTYSVRPSLTRRVTIFRGNLT